MCLDRRMAEAFIRLDTRLADMALTVRDSAPQGLGMYLRTTQRRRKDGSIVRYLALAENVWNA
ncbi:hypothetical protein CKO28_25710, partial [Rhodovibrio sodomensis]|nr:hypothetical protein [Rhodovibrio sodomensis]